MNTRKNLIYHRVCLNCRGDWDLCKGIECQCLDGACCCEFSPEDLEQRAFWYESIKKDSF